jgi:hypothetical protein
VGGTPGQIDRIGELSDQWSFVWDKRRSVWIAAARQNVTHD